MKKNVLITIVIAIFCFLAMRCAKEQLGHCSLWCDSCNHGYVGGISNVTLSECKDAKKALQKQYPDCDCDYDYEIY